MMGYSFITAAAKHLSTVEIDSLHSNQHEFNGVASLRHMLGTERQCFDTTFIYYNETGKVIQESGEMTWYDAREAHPTRTEYRLYYTDNSVVGRANVNDLLIVGKQDDNTLVVIISENGCSYYDLFMNLFGLTNITRSYVITDRIAI